MEQVPLDARSVLDQLRASAPPLGEAPPRSWVPSASFDALLDEADVTPLVLDGHLAWLRDNCDLSHVLAAPEESGVKGWAKRWAYRIVLAVLHPYLVKVQDCIAETVRTLDAVALRVDEQAKAQLQSVTAVRTDLVDFARQVDERLGE